MFSPSLSGTKYYEVESIKGPSYYEPSQFEKVTLVGPLNDIFRVSVDSSNNTVTHVQIIFNKVVRSFTRGQIVEIDMPLVAQEKS